MNRVFLTTSLLFFSLLITGFSTKAQQEKGEIIVSAGIGYSPEFNGGIILGDLFAYPVHTYYPANFYSILPNIGTTIDYNIGTGFSMGLTASYQSILASDYGSPMDRISRTNMAVRFLGHLNKSRARFDNYLGVRLGCSYWHDNPSPQNSYDSIGPSGNVTHITKTFIASPIWLPSFQFLYIMNLYITNNLGFRFEAGIGSPYLAEVGFIYRINTKKSEIESKQ